MATINLLHNVGDPLYKIRMNSSNVPEIVIPEINYTDGKKPVLVEEVHIAKDEIYYETTNGTYLTEERIKNDLWFWSKKEAQDWLDKNYDPEVYYLKPGDKVRGGGETFVVRGLRFGGAWGLVEQQDDWARAHARKEYYDRLKEPFYLLISENEHSLCDRIMIGRGTEEDPYRIEYYTNSRHHPVMFGNVVFPVDNPSISDSI